MAKIKTLVVHKTSHINTNAPDIINRIFVKNIENKMELMNLTNQEKIHFIDLLLQEIENNGKNEIELIN